MCNQKLVLGDGIKDFYSTKTILNYNEEYTFARFLSVDRGEKISCDYNLKIHFCTS